MTQEQEPRHTYLQRIGVLCGVWPREFRARQRIPGDGGVARGAQARRLGQLHHGRLVVLLQHLLDLGASEGAF